jgi:hypothetical protein
VTGARWMAAIFYNGLGRYDEGWQVRWARIRAVRIKTFYLFRPTRAVTGQGPARVIDGRERVALGATVEYGST